MLLPPDIGFGASINQVMQTAQGTLFMYHVVSTWATTIDYLYQSSYQHTLVCHHVTVDDCWLYTVWNICSIQLNNRKLCSELFPNYLVETLSLQWYHMIVILSQIPCLPIVCSASNLGYDQWNININGPHHCPFVLNPFVTGPDDGSVMRVAFPCHDVIKRN